MIKRIFLATLLFVAALPSFAIARDLVKIGEDVSVVYGETLENVVVIGGDISVSGTITDDVVVIGGNINLAPSGRIEGSSVAVFGDIHKALGAFLGKESVIVPNGNMWFALPAFGGWLAMVICLAIMLGMFALLLLCAMFFTSHVGRVSHFTQMHPAKAFIVGVLTSVLLAPIMVMLLVTIVGIPLIPVLVVLVSGATFFGFAAMCQLIGLKFFNAIKRPGKPMLLEVLVGFLAIGLIAMVPVIGIVVKTVLWFMGLGAVVVTRFGTVQRLY